MKKYNVVYADPPWSYNNMNIGCRGESGAAGNYSVMSIADIKAMPIPKIIDDNAVIFLWATVPLLPEGIDVIRAWGFEYKTSLIWKKRELGMGMWFRIGTEYLLVGTRGKVRAFKIQKENFYESRRTLHSAKPNYFRQLVAKAGSASFDNPVKLELFARSRADAFSNYEYEGWDVFGNEVDNSIILPTND